MNGSVWTGVRGLFLGTKSVCCECLSDAPRNKCVSVFIRGRVCVYLRLRVSVYVCRWGLCI